VPAAPPPSVGAPDPVELVALARAAAVAAGDLLLEGQDGAAADVGTKTSGTDMVTAVDRASEALITEALLAARPHDAVLGEEGGLSGAGTSGVRWIVDPLDGTTNFLHAIPHFAINIALEREGAVVAAVTYNPVTNELFWAEKGKGCFLNDHRLRVAARSRLEEAVLATGIPFLGHGQHGRFLKELHR
jgi:myo-inositol-1(or 4)-monophosphatase